MAFEQKPGQGALFKNDKKNAENQPDYRGNVMDLQGNMLDIAAWIKTANSGKKYMSLKLSVPRQQQQGQTRPQAAQPYGGEEPDNPF